MKLDHRAMAERFLAHWGIEPQSLVRHAPPIGPGECLAMAGSIVEGVANEQSDIDLLYFGESPLADKVVMDMDSTFRFGVSHDAQGREINVEQLTEAHVAEMKDRLDRSLVGVYDPRPGRVHFVERNIQRLKMLHRVKTSVPLVNPDVLAAYKSRLRVDELHIYVCAMLTQDVLNRREDIIGELESGNLDSATWMAQTILAPELIAAMLASVGETNAKVKWHFKLLDFYLDELGRERVDAVKEFVRARPEELQDDLFGRLAALTTGVLDDIFARRREVRKALFLFASSVRYADPANLARWQRGTPSLT